MTLTTNGKNYIATNFGIGNCWVSSGLSWTATGIDGSTVNESGGTASIVGRLVSAAYKEIRLTSPRTGTFTKAQLTLANDYNVVSLSPDVVFIANNDGYPSGEPKYCTSVVVTPTPTPTPTPGVTPTPPPPDRAGVFEFVGPITGDPTVILNLSELQMRQTADRHFEMNGIRITNTSSHPIYIAMRIRLFAGDIPYCRDTGFVFDGMDRTDTDLRSLRIKTLEIGESAVYNADFFQPPNILGMHTVCMLVHGAWSRADLVDEIEHIVG